MGEGTSRRPITKSAEIRAYLDGVDQAPQDRSVIDSSNARLRSGGGYSRALSTHQSKSLKTFADHFSNLSRHCQRCCEIHPRPVHINCASIVRETIRGCGRSPKRRSLQNHFRKQWLAGIAPIASLLQKFHVEHEIGERHVARSAAILAISDLEVGDRSPVGVSYLDAPDEAVADLVFTRARCTRQRDDAAICAMSSPALPIPL